jgi:hypothetical protein
LTACGQATVRALQPHIGQLKEGSGNIAGICIETIFQNNQSLGATAQIFLYVDPPAALRHAATNHLRQTIFTGAFVIGMAIGHINNAP